MLNIDKFNNNNNNNNNLNSPFCVQAKIIKLVGLKKKTSSRLGLDGVIFTSSSQAEIERHVCDAQRSSDQHNNIGVKPSHNQ